MSFEILRNLLLVLFFFWKRLNAQNPVDTEDPDKKLHCWTVLQLWGNKAKFKWKDHRLTAGRIEQDEKEKVKVNHLVFILIGNGVLFPIIYPNN